MSAHWSACRFTSRGLIYGPSHPSSLFLPTFLHSVLEASACLLLHYTFVTKDEEKKQNHTKDGLGSSK